MAILHGSHGCALGLEVVVSVVYQVSISSIRRIRYDLGGWGIWKLVSVQGLSAPFHPSVWGVSVQREDTFRVSRMPPEGIVPSVASLLRKSMVSFR